MYKKLFLLAACCTARIAYAQDAQLTMPVTPFAKTFNQSVGVQLNELVRQVFNFSNTTPTATNNPYLLTYTINLSKNGWGLRTGLGYTYQNLHDDDGITARDTRANTFNGRFGIEKAFRISPRWSTGVGADGIYGWDNSKTTTATNSFDSSTTATVSNIKTYGGGAMGWLRFNITPHILIGTEASFYYTSGHQDQVVRITALNFNTGQLSTTESTIDAKTAQGKFLVPAVFYLMVAF